jgi:hypothetical protein
VPRPYAQVAAASNLEMLEELEDMIRNKKLSVHVGMMVAWSDVARVSVVISHRSDGLTMDRHMRRC